ncbi:SDR family oxidoreductase [Novosphingobium sp. KCTC 2891]|uniref:SDR family NAD(P)-dependent oxidoreductase n=1 Tax=Novosphingobium sp. KCTC 2891 TaxID=2989730 RepID=UPI0022217772|nr:SDR family NAD(P)-dependent oxidoreductase [Novosphingobium sp. KCTC 2891]MCW1383807.1 SDR family oxidoreductase [Novosphingobium sp. KCTC 2891]
MTTLLQALVVNSGGREAALVRSALSGCSITEIDAPLVVESRWVDLEAGFAASGRRFDIIVHCPLGASDAAGVEREILSAWLTAKYANRVCAEGEPTLLTITRENLDVPAIDADAAANAIRVATQAAMLDASARKVRLRSNRLAIPAGAEEALVIETVRALCDARASFVAGADLFLGTRSAQRFTRSLTGKAVLVTGATSGIGRASAIEIGREGGWVAIGGRKPDLAAETLALVREAGGDGCFIPLDVTDAAAWADAARVIAAERGALHGLVNNAGEAKNLPIDELDAGVPQFLVNLNYGGCRMGMDAMLDLLAAGQGSVVNVASVAGMRAGFGGSAYGASKAAMIGLSKSYARVIAGPRGVRVNAVQPGLIWSDSVADSLGEEGAQRFRLAIEGKTPIGRVGTPDEVGRFIAFLVSDAAGALTGQAIPISGGLELVHP